ncbi:MAG: DeoR/GlpR family DNA-binding transcription regulator [Anaerolineae bacterium]
MANKTRHQRILDLLESNTHVRVAELSQHLGVSPATVRRDLDRLQQQGWLQRTHGGAVLAEHAAPEPPVVQRTGENAEEKRRIGKAAAALIHEGDTVFIGSGTTTLEVARQLAGRNHITVITNALTIINTLAQEEGITLLSTGGLLRSSELSFIGHISELTLQELRPQKVIMGIRAISLTDGLTNDYVPEVSTDRIIIRSAPEVILVADHSKFGRISTAFVAPVAAVHKIVTDSATPPEILRELRQKDIEVIVA